MLRVIFNQKGGVGKTSIVCNLAAISAVENGLRTLVVDLDEQANATQYLLGPEAAASVEPTVSDFFEQTLALRLFASRTSVTDYIHQTPFENLLIMPADARLGEQQARLENRYKIYKLREALDQLEDLLELDAVYLDTPPALNFYTRSALIAANRCLIPFDCDSFSRRALYDLLENAQEIKVDHNPSLEVEGIIVNQFQARAKLPTKLVDELIAEELPVLDTYLSTSVKIRESHERAKPLVAFDRNHKLSEEFRDLYRQLG